LNDTDDQIEKALRQTMDLESLELDEDRKDRIWMKIQKATCGNIQVGSVDFSRKAEGSVVRSAAFRSVPFRYALSLVLLLAALLLFIFV
jgi:hypothetical protein